MYRRIIYLVIIVCVVCTVLAGCRGDNLERSFNKACQKLLKLEAYTCYVAMSVTNNRSTMEYKLKHSYMSPDKYRIEVLEPEGLKGQVTIHSSKGTYIYHPGINQHLITENFSDSAEHEAFVGSFISHIRSKEKLKVSKETVESKVYYILEFEVPKPNGYMNTEKMWIDAGETVPVKAEIYDKAGKITVLVNYTNFVYNPKLDVRDFEITDTQN